MTETEMSEYYYHESLKLHRQGQKSLVHHKRKVAGPVLKETFRNGRIHVPYNKASHQWTFETYKMKDDTVEWSNRFLKSGPANPCKGL